MRCYSRDGNPYFLPLQAAITHCRTDIGMYLLTLVGPTENLGRSLDAGTNLLHHTARSRDLPSSEALVRRGVDFDQRNDAGMTPFECAIKWSRMPVVRYGPASPGNP
jgi:ankyrin repeat protein